MIGGGGPYAAQTYERDPEGVLRPPALRWERVRRLARPRQASKASASRAAVTEKYNGHDMTDDDHARTSVHVHKLSALAHSRALRLLLVLWRRSKSPRTAGRSWSYAGWRSMTYRGMHAYGLYAGRGRVVGRTSVANASWLLLADLCGPWVRPWSVQGDQRFARVLSGLVVTTQDHAMSLCQKHMGCLQTRGDGRRLSGRPCFWEESGRAATGFPRNRLQTRAPSSQGRPSSASPLTLLLLHPLSLQPRPNTSCCRSFRSFISTRPSSNSALTAAAFRFFCPHGRPPWPWLQSAANEPVF
ncbi:hypothetical protein OH77DRAFT_17815 [Trametes cingulata]|nr:hypothetical protein OH77DRAFT_17815 [Trametes cingulata]